MSNLYGKTTALFSTPYLTLDEFKQAPTAIDYNNLVANSTDGAVQDAELANAISRASSWIDTYCNQVLAATTETELQRVRMSADGYIKLHPRYWPILEVTAFSYGATPNGLVAYGDLSQGWLEDQSIVMPWTGGTTNAGPLGFGAGGGPRLPVYASVTYVSGYANTLLSASASASATSVAVADPTGILPGSHLTIYDGTYTENVVVASSYTPGNATVAINGSLSNAHASKVAISALPPAVKQAAILATTAFLKARGDYAMTMAVTNVVGEAQAQAKGLNYDLEIAKELLLPFRRVR